MSIKAPERLGEALAGRHERVPPPVPRSPEEPGEDPELERPEAPIRAGLTSIASFLSAAAAGFAAGSLFVGVLPRVVGVAAAAAGAATVWLSYRTRRTSLIQLSTVALAFVAGALLMVLDAPGANLPGLVGEALRIGGLAQPPVPFDPGWRFLLVLSIWTLAAASAAISTGLNRPSLGVFIPIPIIFGALAAQSNQSEVTSTIGALVLLVGGLAVSFGVDLAREGATSGGFELRRFAKGGGALVLLIAMLAGVTQLGFLFPESTERLVVPPQRPKPQPPQPDRELFVVKTDRQMPWRLGVLDVYDGRGWLTPPFDTERFVPVPTNRTIPAIARSSRETVRVAFTISDVSGHLLPGVANPIRVSRSGFDVEFDPRTQTLRLPTKRATRGMTYTVEALAPPQSQELAQAGDPPDSMIEFLFVPPPPAEIADLLSQATGDGFSRLQFVRGKLYENVVAKGAGPPEDIRPQRVVQLMAGEVGTPFEITAAEALLSRWVGVPSRIGYGYFGGDSQNENQTSVRPRHSATWLESYFEGYGWVPIVGTPPRAQSSLTTASNPNPSVRPSENLTLLAYVPLRRQSIQLLYLLVQYWVVRTVPYLMLAGLALWLYPGVVKRVRGWKRRRWAARGGASDRIRVAYAEFRDAARDFNVGYPSLTPIEFLANFEDDAEHRELAWLVTRCLWGDLARDVMQEDADLAEEMSRSLAKRLKSAQPAVNRLLAYASRNSLRDPFSDEMPNLWWPELSLRSRVRDRLLHNFARIRRRARRLAAATGMFVLIVLLMSACVRDVRLAGSPPEDLPQRLVPESLDDLTFRREPSTEKAYRTAGSEAVVGAARVFSVHRGDDVLGALQVVALKQAVSNRPREVRSGIIEGLGGGRFALRRFGPDLIYYRRLPEQQFFLWFPPKGGYYELFIGRTDFEGAGEVFANLLAYQRGEAPVEVHPPADPRRGFEG